MEQTIDKLGRELALRGNIEDWLVYEKEKGILSQISSFLEKCDDKIKSWVGGGTKIEKSVGTRRGMIDASTLVIKCMAGEIGYQRAELDLVKELLKNMEIADNLAVINENPRSMRRG